MKHAPLFAAALLGAWAFVRPAPAAEPPPRNVVLFVADGLRGAMVDDSTAPNLA